jgi:Uncharacterised conserved protein
MDLLEGYGSSDDENDPTRDDDPSVIITDPEESMVAIIPSSSVPSGTFVRAMPHVAGNWAGHVFSTIPIDDELRESLTASLSRFQQHLKTTHKIPPSAGHQKQRLIISHLNYDHLHLSLSRPFTLQLASIDSFVTQLQKRLCLLPGLTLRLNLSAERLLVNDERTRSFWTVPVDANPTLMTIVEAVDAVLKTYNQPSYYSPPLFHISIGSVVGDLVDETNTTDTIPPLNLTTNSNNLRYVKVKQVECTFGTTKSYSMKLLER